MAVEKECQGNKCLLKTMSFSYQIEQKSFIEASCANIIDTGEKFFATVTFEGLCVVTF